MKRFALPPLLTSLVLLLVALAWYNREQSALPDDAQAAGKTPADFPQTSSHAFDEMDSAIALSYEERQGRNTWILWTAGDQLFWDHIARLGFGTADLLKLIDSRNRGSRFKAAGLVNQPGFVAASKPDEYGIWLDELQGDPEPGVDTTVYGRPSGVIGLRIYPNPDFNKAARQQWDPNRYYNDAAYYNDSKLIRPYRVGMSCGFCHVSFNPAHPPGDPERPEWRNLSSTIGNQYLKAEAVFAATVPASSYVRQLLASWAPGTIDTSFLATDNLNNPSNMNPIFALPARLATAHEEEVVGGALNFPGEKPRMAVSHVLKDGADSVGITAALTRVYVSIGEYSQEWLRDHNVIIGGKPQRPFSVANAQQNSVYWRATAERIPNMTKFLFRMQGPKLADAPGGAAFLLGDRSALERGKIVFTENCFRCHSSKQPAANMDRDSEQYRDWARKETLKADFLQNNFLSTDARIAISIVKTNATRALATNATRGHVWDNFSSETYKTLPSAGEIDVTHPIDGTAGKFRLPQGGPGYYRVPSLVSIWATAPFLHNNALGAYTGDPSVAGRMAAFNDAVEKLLWPEKRVNRVLRTSAESYIEIPDRYLPERLQPLVENGTLRIGPIPEGTPIDLLANVDLDLTHFEKLSERLNLMIKVQRALRRITREQIRPEQAPALLATLAPDLLSLSKCPDFIQDHGHYFGTKLSDPDKRALIEYLKTF
jgi:hypothetical protein